jgi:hypothetical protein
VIECTVHQLALRWIRFVFLVKFQDDIYNKLSMAAVDVLGIFAGVCGVQCVSTLVVAALCALSLMCAD